MESGPIYFIGGTFGSGSSGWIIAIITALVTAFGAFVIGLLHEDYKRHRDRRGLAAAFLAEITSLMQLVERLRIEAVYRDKRTEMEQALTEGKGWQGSPQGVLTFPVTIYEKSADRVGILDANIAAAVVTFYNFVNGFRVHVRLAVEAGDQPIASRIRVIESLLEMLATEQPKVEALRQRLHAVVERSWRPFVE